MVLHSGFFNSIASPGAQDMTWTLVFLVVYASVAIVVGIVMYYLWLYNSRALIFEMRGGKIARSSFDFVRKQPDQNGILRMKLFKKKEEFPPPSSQDGIYLLGRKDLYILYRSQSGEYYHMSIGELGTLNIIDPDVNLWTGLTLQEKSEKYNKQSWLERHQTFILALSSLVFVLVIVWFALQHIDSVVSKIDGIANGLNRIADKLAEYGSQQIDSFNR